MTSGRWPSPEAVEAAWTAYDERCGAASNVEDERAAVTAALVVAERFMRDLIAREIEAMEEPRSTTVHYAEVAARIRAAKEVTK